MDKSKEETFERKANVSSQIVCEIAKKNGNNKIKSISILFKWIGKYIEIS